MRTRTARCRTCSATTAKNFGGEGAQFHQTIQDFSTLSKTLDDNKEALFGSARELEGFINTLATNDKTVRQFNQSLSDVSDMLSGEKEELATALHNLSIGLGDVATLRHGQPRHPEQEHRRTSTGSRRCWSSSARRSTRRCATPRWR